jgi:hypothetical protein
MRRRRSTSSLFPSSKYVTLLGSVLAEQSSRPKLTWTFIVLDTDGVNAFASPGGFVHVTRGALALVQNESELAGVLGHEIGHVVQKHTLKALRKNNAVKLGTDAAGQASGRAQVIAAAVNAAYENVLENAYDRGDELDADRVAVQLAQKAGYKAGTLGDFLARLADRNKDVAERNGLFASHPETSERITRIGREAAASKTTAVGAVRYKEHVAYKPTPITAIATVTEGSAGLAGSGSASGDKKAAEKAPQKEEPRRRGFGLSALKPGASQEKQSTQVSASGGARGLGADRAAKGGSNPQIVKTAVTAGEVAAFRKGIV